MNNTASCLINQPPALSYSWLKTGGVLVEKPAFMEEIKPREERPLKIAFTRQTAPSFSGEDPWESFFSEGIFPINCYHLPEKEEASEALRLGFDWEDKQAARYEFSLDAASRLTAVMDFSMAKQGDGALMTRIKLKKDARLNLVQISRGEGDYTLFNSIAVEAEEGASCQLIRLVLGGLKSFDRVQVSLKGEKSLFDCGTAYRLEDARELDMNYEILHFGRHTESDIRAAGVLADRSYKIFRGTIDLKKGCSGSQGSEIEEVLMMDDTVRNKTLPVILCGEENVSGNHGATIGRLDENLLYYMESRGLDRERIYELAAAAKIHHAIRRIPDEKTKRELFPEIMEEA